MANAAIERVPVLMYHCIAPGDFARHMQALAGRGHVAVRLAMLAAWLEGAERLPPGAFVLTFDDGYRDVREHAHGVLRRLGWPFTVFLVSALIGTRDVWNAAQSGQAPRELLGRDEILEMARGGADFQSHARTHRRLPLLPEDELRAELLGSRIELEALLGQPVRYLAYPFGEHDERVVAAAKAAGYAAAFSTQPGFNRRDVDRFGMRRLDVRGTDSCAQLLRKVALGTNDGSVRGLAGYFGRRAARRLWQAGRAT